QAYYRRGDPQHAVQSMTAALALAPDNTVARLIRGGAYRDIGETARALTDLDHLLLGDPANLAALDLRAALHATAARPASAHRDLTRILEARPDALDLRRRRAAAAQAMGDYAGAIADLNQVLAAHPGDAEALLARGEAQLSAGHADAAVDDATAAISEGTRGGNTDVAALILRGRAYRRLNQTEAAVADLDMAQRMQPYQAQALREKARALLFGGRWGEASAAYERLVPLGPNDAEPHGVLAFLRLRTDDLAGAGADISRGLAAAPGDPWLRTLQAELTRRQGKPEQAAIAASALIAEGKPTSLLLRIRGFSRLALNLIDDALADFTKATEVNPGDAAAWAGQAEAEKILRRYGVAVQHFTRALDIDGSFAGAYLGRANVHAARTDTGAAEQDRAAALRIDPDLAPDVDKPGGWRLDNRLTLADLPFSS
ncbi:MAG: tetratricopeptide repeat protein, partial [Alphaproteobacteria bacterium]